MSQQLETYTEQLLDIIQILQRQRATGVLQVRRGEGITAEEGRIAFANGRITDARAGRRAGSDAVSWISTWTMCWVRFLSNNPTFSLEKALRMIGPSPANNAAQRLDTPMGPQGNRKGLPLPYTGVSDSHDPEHKLTPMGYTPIPDVRAVSPLRRQRNSADSMHSSETSSSAYISGSLSHSSETSSSARPSGSLPPIAIELVIPMMIVRLDVALRMLEANGLTRVHRQLLLLTDGKRPIGELMRIAQRDRDDVFRMLQDLEKIHAIQLMPG